ncbi:MULTISPECIES: hypothetical protein [unclassified Sphingomonas]|uniref:hypothetical protein n=1 Tax=unclassified Sphingomonas TaxID=196159 RepID=UPI002150D112|nr:MULTISPECIES: hypothetical protein [unclassified Sphingomonas]MCR5872439.1 hypothetical protein [Sphingomonas sp. J344]UUX99280.1 hypothetical protein LRS08_17715 [Sphingomonas sp. J315]
MTPRRLTYVLFTLAGAVALLAGCQQEPDSGNATAATPSATPSATGVRALPEAEQLKLAFRTTYGKDGAAQVQEDDAGVINVTPGQLLWIGDIAVLLSPGANESDCHACSGALAIAYLKPQGDGFAVTGKWPTLVRGSGWGAEPEWRVTNEFTDNPAIYVESGDTAQGYSCGGASITELKPDGPVQSERIWLSASNEGAVDEATGKTFGGEPLSKLEGEIVDIVKGKSFAVQASGTAKFVERYEYRDGKFVPLQKESRLSC